MFIGEAGKIFVYLVVKYQFDAFAVMFQIIILNSWPIGNRIIIREFEYLRSGNWYIFWITYR